MDAETKKRIYRFSFTNAIRICSENPGGWLATVFLTQVIISCLSLKGKKRPSNSVVTKAGLLAVVEFFEVFHEADNVLMSGSNPPDDETLVRLLLYMGGLRSLSVNPSGKVFLSKISKNQAKIEAIYLLVDFLLRTRHYSGERRIVLEDAYEYVAAWSKSSASHNELGTRLNLTPLKPRTVLEYWRQLRAAAPIVYATRRHFPHIATYKNFTELVTDLHKLCIDRETRNRFLGEAAFAADVLNELAKDFSSKAYKKIVRVAPDAQPFRDFELEIINSIDRSGSLEAPDFRPKMLPAGKPR